MQAGHKSEQDGFLRRCVRARGTKSVEKEFSENVASITRRHSAPAFSKAAQDPSRKRALDKAAKLEAAREQRERDAQKDMNRER